jgi:hypothetical protein
MISSTIVLTNLNNKLERLATYNENGIQPFFQRKKLGMFTTTHCVIQKRWQIIQASCPKHFQCGHQPSNKDESFIRLPNNNIR